MQIYYKHLNFNIITCIAFAMLLGTAKPVHGQTYGSLSDRLYAGGSLGLAFGGRITQIDLLPVAGVWIVPQWGIGLGGRYTFRNEHFNLETGSSASNKTHIWGLSAYTQLLPIPSLHDAFGIPIDGGPLLHAECEQMWVNSHGERLSTRLFLLGGGWRQKAGKRAAVSMMALWNLSRNTYSPYIDNPILRFSITF